MVAWCIGAARQNRFVVKQCQCRTTFRLHLGRGQHGPLCLVFGPFNRQQCFGKHFGGRSILGVGIQRRFEQRAGSIQVGACVDRTLFFKRFLSAFQKHSSLSNLQDWLVRMQISQLF